MSEQSAARVQVQVEDVTTPPPAYLERGTTTTTGALVQHETNREPEIVGATSVPESREPVTREKSLPLIPAEMSASQTEYVHRLLTGVSLPSTKFAKVHSVANL